MLQFGGGEKTAKDGERCWEEVFLRFTPLTDESAHRQLSRREEQLKPLSLLLCD